MKKNSKNGINHFRYVLKKALFAMKLTTLIFLISTLSLMAGESYSQNMRISLNMKNVQIKDVLLKIENSSEFFFIYNNQLIDVDRIISVNANNEKIKDILVDIFKDQQVEYQVTDRKIVIAPLALANEQTPVRISGKVTDASGSPLPGVTVTIKGTSIGIITDFEGNFTLSKIPNDAILVFSFIGMKMQEVAVGDKKNINVTLVEENIRIEEVVAIGYGTVKRKDVTGSISSISDKKFADRAVSRIDQALVGAIPGLDIVSSGSTPGAGSTILLRGKRSFTASNDPLTIVDGMPFYGSLNDLNPFDVKSIDVLKDASSTAIYGSRGANGVIIITTKRGNVSKPTFMLESSAGPEVMFGRIPMANGSQYAEWTREAYRAQGGYPYTDTNPTYDAIIFDAIELPTVQSGGAGQDYLGMLLQNGFQQKHQLTVNGGSEAIQYNFAGNYFKQEGLMPGDVFSRFTLSTNLDIKLSDKITTGTSIQLAKTENNRKSNPSAFNYAINGNPLGQVRDTNGEIMFATMADSYEINPMVDYWYDSYRYDAKTWSAFINAYGQAKITPSLTYRISLGYNFKLGTTNESSGYYSIARNKGLPTASVANAINNFSIYESTLTYNKIFNESHHIMLTAVQGYQISTDDASGASVMDLPYEASRYYNIGTANTVTGVSSGHAEWVLLSYVGRLNYDYKSKYLITMSLRADGASQFAPGHKWGYFPSISTAYRITEEKFMAGTKEWLSDLKIRLGYGVTGNQAISPYQTQGGLARTTYAWNEAFGFGYRPANLANKNLKWESTAVFNFGLDFGLLNQRITGSLELYNTNTYDLLMYRKLPITTGFDQVLENVGKTNNKGIEIGLHTVNIDKNNFRWSTDISFYSNNTKIVELYQGKVDDIGNQWFIGHPINVYYDYKKVGIWQLGEEADAAKYGEKVGQIKLDDVNTDGKYNSSDLQILGDNEPDFVANISNQFTYKGWDFAFSTYLRMGGMTSVGQFGPFSKKRYNKIIFDYWTPTNPTNAYPRPNQLYEGSGLYGSTLTYRDASHINISMVSLGYTLPKTITSKLNINKARVFLSGENLFYWTASELAKFHMKPDWSGTTVTTYPATRKIVMGVNLVF
ncbi:MAG TPA: SusC/RagA family TonB-linked outer membrane protein [Prolixibacteraceae bacterium]|nr:SusC/RagA family TonB-linked outer membrane protein [Prolixibacteraceae bacterium]